MRFEKARRFPRSRFDLFSAWRVGSLLFLWFALQGGAQSIWIDQTPKNLNAVTYGKGLYVTVGEGGYIATAGSNLKWHRQVSPSTNELYEVIFAKDSFWAVGERGTIISSTNGTNWLWRRESPGQTLKDIKWGHNLLMAVGWADGPVAGQTSGIILTSHHGWD